MFYIKIILIVGGIVVTTHLLQYASYRATSYLERKHVEALRAQANEERRKTVENQEREQLLDQLIELLHNLKGRNNFATEIVNTNEVENNHELRGRLLLLDL